MVSGPLGPDGGATHTAVKKKAAAPKKAATKPKTVARPVSQGYDKKLPIKETTPYYGSGQLLYNQYQNVPAPKAKQPSAQSPQTRTAVANGVQVAGANVPAATKAAKKVASNHPAGGGITGDPGGGVVTTQGTAQGTMPGSTVSSPPSAPAPAAPAAPATTRDVVIPDYPVDPGYQQQMAALIQGLTDFGATRDQALRDYNTNYGNTLYNVGWDPTTNQWNGQNPNTQYGAAARNNQEDYGGSGMVNSTAYFDSLGNMDNLFNRQVGQLATAKTQYTGQQNDAYNAYARQNALAKTQAAIDAASRIAAPLGVTGKQVTQNPGKTITIPVTGA